MPGARSCECRLIAELIILPVENVAACASRTLERYFLFEVFPQIYPSGDCAHASSRVAVAIAVSRSVLSKAPQRVLVVHPDDHFQLEDAIFSITRPRFLLGSR